MHKVALITGAAQRVGAAITRDLHEQGWNVVIHHYNSVEEATELVRQLNTLRSNSAQAVCADLSEFETYTDLINAAYHQWRRLDAVIHNAAQFYPTCLGTTTLTQWNNLMDSNLRAPFFLTQTAIPYLKATQGSIIMLGDVQVTSPQKNYSVYSVTKAGLETLTRALAVELAPEIRVNMIALGPVLDPVPPNDRSLEAKTRLLTRLPLQQRPDLISVMRAIHFCLSTQHLTGAVIPIDSGLHLTVV